MASQRVQVLQRILMPGELERAQQFGQAEFKQIVETLQPPKPAAPPPTEMAGLPRPAFPPLPPTAASASEPPGWPKATTDQIRVIQQALVDLKLLRDKPDGALGPMTRNAIRAFQRSVAMRETGDPTVDVFVALQDAIKAETAKADSADKAQAAKADGPPSPPVAGTEPTLDVWPSATVDQVKVIQTLLRDLNFSREAPDGVLGPATRAAIRDYERSLGLAQTGEPSKTLFDSAEGNARPDGTGRPSRTLSARRTCRRAATRPPAAPTPHVVPVPANRRGQSRWHRCRSWRRGALRSGEAPREPARSRAQARSPLP